MEQKDENHIPVGDVEIENTSNLSPEQIDMIKKITNPNRKFILTGVCLLLSFLCFILNLDNIMNVEWNGIKIQNAVPGALFIIAAVLIYTFKDNFKSK
jgi:hypothetical protein